MIDKSMLRDIDNLIKFDSGLREALENAVNNKYLKQHKGSIWFNDKKRLYMTKLGGKQATSKTKDGLNRKIIEYYKSKALSYKQVMIEELDKKLAQHDILKSSYDRYLNYYDRYVSGSKLDKTPVSETSEKQIRDFLREKIINGISKKNFNNLISLLNIVYFYSELTNIYVSDIKRKMNLQSKNFDKSNRRPTTDIIWSDKEQEMLKNYTDIHSDDIRALGMLFMLQTGLAISELVGLKPKDVDIDKRRLTVNRIERHYKDENNKTVYVLSEDGSAKTDNRLETMNISYKAVDTYNRMLAISKAKEPDDLIFGGLKCHDFDTHARRHILKELGISQRGAHSLRKSFATNLIDKHVEPSVVAKQMRHSDISTTFKHYYKCKKSEEEIIKTIDSVA